MIEKLGIRLYNQHDAADVLGVTVQTIRAMCRDGRLTKTKLGVNVYIPEDSLRAYLTGISSQKKTSHAAGSAPH